jgi:hypothetical protein
MEFLITLWQQRQASVLLHYLSQFVSAVFGKVLGIMIVYPALLEFTKASGRLRMPGKKTIEKTLVLI